MPESGRFDQLVSAVTWNRISQPRPDGAAVTSGVPSASAAQVRSDSAPSGSASTWRLTRTSSGTVIPAKGLASDSVASGCSTSQVEAAAEHAVAVPEADRDQGIGCGGEMRPGEADQRPTLGDPLRHLLLDVGRQRADVGHDDDRRAGLDQLGDGDGGVGVARLGDVGEGLHGAGDVVERREERLRRVGGGAGEEPDPPAAPAVVEELHRARGLGADHVEPGDVVAQLDRQLDPRLGLARAGLEGEGHVADAPAAEVGGADEAGGGQLRPRLRITGTTRASAAPTGGFSATISAVGSA